MTAQMSKLTTGVAESVEPPWLSCRAHLRLVPGLSASLAPDSRSQAAMVDGCAAELVDVDFHQRAVVVAHSGPSPSTSYLLMFFCRSTNQCTNLDYLVQCIFPREGPVRLPQHLQYINRSRSHIRSLSLLRSPCSPLLPPRFPSCCTGKGLQTFQPQINIVFQGPGRMIIR